MLSLLLRVVNQALVEMNCSVISGFKIMHVLKKIGVGIAVYCYACLKLHWTLFDLGEMLKFRLDFNSTLLFIDGGGILF